MEDEAELDDALSRMIADLEQSLELAAVEAKDDAVAEDGTYVVKNGDYLDKIISDTVGQSPLRRDILRSAFVRANPHAFMRSNPNWLLANKKLRVPDAEDIKKVIFTDESRRDKKQRAQATPMKVGFSTPNVRAQRQRPAATPAPASSNASKGAALSTSTLRRLRLAAARRARQPP